MGIQQISEAYARFAEWLQEADRLRGRFEALGQVIPGPLRMAIDVPNGDAPNSPPVSIAAPSAPVPRPASAGDDWICLDAEVVSVAVLALSVLISRGPMRGQGIVDKVVTVKAKGQNAGSVFNSLSALERSGKVRRDRESGIWKATGSEKDGPLLAKDDGSTKHYVWGPLGAFTRQDVAQHRRDAIRHILAAHRSGGGLMPSQLLPLLEGVEWMKGPVSKDLVKADLEAMQQEDVIRRAGNSRKWVLKE